MTFSGVTGAVYAFWRLKSIFQNLTIFDPPSMTKVKKDCFGAISPPRFLIFFSSRVSHIEVFDMPLPAGIQGASENIRLEFFLSQLLRNSCSVVSQNMPILCKTAKN